MMVRTPSFYKARINADALIAFYTAVADASPVPVILYNVTMFTGVNLAPDDGGHAVGASEHHRHQGLGRRRHGDLRISWPGCRPGFAVLAGSTSALYASLVVGATGATIGPADVAPDICAALMAAVEAGRHDEARRLQARLMPIAKSVGALYGIPGLKAAVDACGLAGGPPRPPLRAVSRRRGRAHQGASGRTAPTRMSSHCRRRSVCCSGPVRASSRRA